jgi:hypothetical protein
VGFSGRQVILGFAIGTVGSAIVAGLMIVGSPGNERMRRLDGRRVRDLVDITRSVNGYWTKHARLPSSLDELLESPGTAVESRDPLTGQPYSFGALGANTYELCADFQRESSEANSDTYGHFWSHGTGRRCFRLEAEETHR